MRRWHSDTWSIGIREKQAGDGRNSSRRWRIGSEVRIALINVGQGI